MSESNRRITGGSIEIDDKTIGRLRAWEYACKVAGAISDQTHGYEIGADPLVLRDVRSSR
jgi:hypothetical protein